MRVALAEETVMVALAEETMMVALAEETVMVALAETLETVMVALAETLDYLRSSKKKHDVYSSNNYLIIMIEILITI